MWQSLEQKVDFKMKLLASLILGLSLSVVRWEPSFFDLVLPIAILLGYRYFSWSPGHVLALVLIGLFMLSQLLSLFLALGRDFDEVVPWDRMVFYMLVTFYVSLISVVFMGLKEKVSIYYFLAGYFVGALLFSLLGIFAFLGMPGLESLLWGGSRLVGLFKDPNVFGAFLVPALLFSLAESSRRKPLWLLGFLLLLAALLLSLSRGAWVNFLVALVAWTFLRPKARWPLTLLMFSLFIATFLYATLLLGDTFSSRLGFQPYDRDRFSKQVEALVASWEDPIGKGPGSAEYFLEYATHNSYVRLAFETGWVSLCFWLAFVGLSMAYALRCGLKQGSLLHEIIFASLAGILAESFVIDTLHWRHMWIMLGLAWSGYACALSDHPSRARGGPDASSGAPEGLPGQG
ncbi:hypothetical protein [Thermus sp. 93170]|uniref:hypothetical protein n=1 Tax=Thermus sp. 93170 TaxID=1046939 RepID=UPI003F42CA9B